MFNFFNPPAPKPRLSQDKIPAKYAQMRLRVFLGAFLGYAAYYLVRKNLSLAAPGMIESGLLDKASVGLAGSAISIAYAFSKFIMGSLSDRSDARKFLVVGLILSSLLMICTGLIPYSHTNPGINVGIIFGLMLLVGWVYCSIRGYSDEMFNISMAVILYKFIDALADVYEGRLQQVDKLYLAGISQTLRSVAALVVFSVALLISHNAVVACYAMAIVAAATFVVFTWPLTLMEAPPSSPFSFPSFLELFKVCAPLFLALFLFNVIENMPKFVMEGALPYDNQLYYNAIYFPAQMILIASQLVYKPLLLRMAGVWQDASKRMKFNMLLVGIFAVIAVITAIACGIMAWIGIPVMNFLYGIDFKQFRGLLFLMLITGGITAAIDFIYQVITIMRRQKDVTVLYLVTFGFSLFIPYLLVHYAELEGAVLSYVIIESILFVLLVWEYFRIRRDLARGVGRYAQEQGAGLSENGGAHGHAPAGEHRPTYRDGAHDGEGHSPERPTFLELIDPADAGIDDQEELEEVEEPPVRPLPSEIRAERERRAEIMRRRTGKDR